MIRLAVYIFFSLCSFYFPRTQSIMFTVYGESNAWVSPSPVFLSVRGNYCCITWHHDHLLPRILLVYLEIWRIFFFFLFLNDLELVLFFFSFSFYFFVHTGSIVSFINLTSHGVTQNHCRNKVNLMSEGRIQYQIRVNESTC